MSLEPKQIQPFLDLFEIEEKGDRGISNLIYILTQNGLIEGDEELISNPYFFFWLPKPFDEIKTIMEEKGIWFNGMTKYFAIKVLLLSHTVVQEHIQKSPDTITDANIGTTETISDTREMITAGPHYETLPVRDFNSETKRQTIREYMLHNHFNNNPTLTSFTPDHLKVLYNLYNNHSFGKELSSMLNKNKCTIEFGTNITSTRKAGDHTKDGTKHIIRVSQYMINNLFTNGEKTVKSNGLIICDRLSGLINVFEHELVHLYCSLKGYTRKIDQGKGKMYYSPHGKLFQELVFRFFGHTDYRHNFNNGDTSEQLIKGVCKMGMSIYFDTSKGKVYGKIVKLNPKRCKVNAEDELSYNVPYEMLRKSDRNVIVPDKVDIDVKKKHEVGMKVKFLHNKHLVGGIIIKCNPKRARVDTVTGVYDVPYEGLKLIFIG